MKSQNILFGLSTFFIALLLLSFVSASCENYGTFKQSQAISLVQTCTTCSTINASITLPDSSSTGLITFQNINGIYNYTFSNTNQLGTYNVIGTDAWCYSFEVTPNGLLQTTSQGIGSFAYMLLIFGLTILFGWLGFKYLDSNYVWVLGIFFLFLSLLFIVYDVWLGYEYSLNYTGTGEANIIGILFYIFLFILVGGLITSLILLFTKWKKVREWYKKIKEEGEREEAEDDSNWQ
jgi:TRAP-type C4-dicarboxylate transport system permease small subunit